MLLVHDNIFVSRGSHLWSERLQVKTSASHGNGVVIVDNNKKVMALYLLF